jgi:beta-mannosidase
MGEVVMMPAGTPDTAEDASFAPWSCCAQPAGTITYPDQLRAIQAGWLAAVVPGTAAAALHTAGAWDFARPMDLDACDWWYRTTFRAPELRSGAACHLCFDGLATLAEVWLNGRRVLTTDNMFRSYRIEISRDLRSDNELVIGFRSLSEELKRKHPRPRWKTNLVRDQQLRWHRTSLLGRMPGWSPPVPVVGPWRAVRLETRPFSFSDFRLCSRLEGCDGVVTLEARLHGVAPLTRALLNVAGQETPAHLRFDAGSWLLHAMLRVPSPPLWWPHTHGEQPRSDCSLRLTLGSEQFHVPCGAVGFRQVRLQQDNGFTVHVNDVPVYCRGACWTVGDIISPGGSSEALAHDLRLAREAGANMLRVGGTMVYESDRFYQLCDELGILVWQDFMFANMDYPVEDAGFRSNIEAEARQQLSRLSAHPCVAIFCGNSEVEQQAAMRGAPREAWRNSWFANDLPALCAEYNPESVYLPSSPAGGTLPFHVRTGVAHYYGVGAYLRTPADLRKDDVAFASECLAFANVPEPATVSAIMREAAPALHEPRWKERVPRDTATGWDFDDVRDFYLAHLFGVDPVRLRSCDMPRYLQLSRVVSGEMMSAVFSEWRSGHSRNGGGLVWFFKDLWPAAGWGIIDSFGVPKAPYYYLRRSWRCRQIALTDEGLDGLHLHVTNETAGPFDGQVELLLLKDGHVAVARAEVPCRLPPRGTQTFASDALLDDFHDVTWSYRFGPPAYEVAIATLLDHERRMVSEAFHFVRRVEPVPLSTVNVDAEARIIGQGSYEITLRSDRFLHGVSFDAKGFLPEDNYFHLPPERPRRLRLTALESSSSRFRASVEALNLRSPVPIRLTSLSCGR